MKTRSIVIVTCAAWPELSASDAALAEELERRGHVVSARPWNDAPLDDFTSADMVVLRSNWDYHYNLAVFDNWLTQVEQSGAELHNPARLVRDHHHKSYLHRYSDLGIPTPATLTLDNFDDVAIRSWMDAKELETIVLKPAWGASGHRVERAEASELQGLRPLWEANRDHRGLVAQEFLPSISAGEYGLVFFANEFSHALLRQPAVEDFRVNGQYGGKIALATDVDPAVIELGFKVLTALPTQATYARIDVVLTGGSATLMEVEVNEPALGLHLATGSPTRFANALLAPSAAPPSVILDHQGASESTAKAGHHCL